EHCWAKTPPRDQKKRLCEQLLVINAQKVFTASRFLVEESAKRPFLFITTRFLVGHRRAVKQKGADLCQHPIYETLI
ncbi:MAG: hypothetical protein Q4G41_03675, partial [Coriobacteriales bacterium]|nr:hypothetical protein [Coriobacteriales bacterium]